MATLVDEVDVVVPLPLTLKNWLQHCGWATLKKNRGSYPPAGLFDDCR